MTDTPKSTEVGAAEAEVVQAVVAKGVDGQEEVTLTPEALAQKIAAEAAALKRETSGQTDAVRADVELTRSTQDSPSSEPLSSQNQAAQNKEGNKTWWGTLIGGISVAATKVKEVLGTLGKSISDGLASLFGKAKKEGKEATEAVKESVKKAVYKLAELLKPEAPVFTFLAAKTPHITSPFGRRESPDKHGHYESHNGVDITLAPGNEDIGEPIVATKPLIVQKVSVSKTGANQITLQDPDNPGTTYSFGHLDELPDLVAGTVLEPGALIGKIGNTGRSTAAHLHFTVMKNGEAVDPLQYSGLA